MKPDKLVVKVRCKCGNVITIRTTSDKTRVGVGCWYCPRKVYFVMRGFMKCQGYCIEENESESTVEAWVDYQGQ